MCKERKNQSVEKDKHIMSSPKKTRSSEEQLQLDHNKEIIKSIISSRRHSKQKPVMQIDYMSYALLAFIVLITIITYPANNKLDDIVTIHHVWYYGWMTAVATGLGAIPFLFFSEPNKFWMGISNAIAGGMMIAATYSLIIESVSFNYDDFGILAHFSGFFPNKRNHSAWRSLSGFVLGVLFIMITKKVLERFEEDGDGDGEKVEDKIVEKEAKSAHAHDRKNWQKMILIVLVMTLHSLSEGIGIGVSFGGEHGMKLGQFISLSLAVHNIPEGLAVGLVMTARKVSIVRTALWAIFTSLPQPLFAVPAYLFVERFAPLLPGGLGFAAGAMSYVAIFELLVESMEDTASLWVTGSVGTVACLGMYYLQEAVKVAL